MQCKFLKHGLAISYDHVVKPCCEWVSNHAVTCLKANLWLECILANGTNHLEWNVWAVEQMNTFKIVRSYATRTKLLCL